MEKLKKLFKNLFKCQHKNAILNSNEGYCPDCGKYLKKSYYVIRCSCCDIKRVGKKQFDKIIPSERFCTNCGNEEYIIEKYDKLNLVDINYAIEVKEVIESDEPINNIEIWIDNDNAKKEDKKENIPLICQMKYLNG